MGETTKIMRRSIFTFLQNYQHFTSIPSLLAFPFAISTLLSQSVVSSSHLLPLLHNRLLSISLAFGLPSSKLTSVLNLKLSQTILVSLFALPFTLSFLLFAKAAIIASLKHQKPHKKAFSHWIKLFNPLLVTQLCNSLIIISSSATCLFILAIFYNFFTLFHLPVTLLSITGGVIYSIILANTYTIFNLALILSGIEKHGGFISIFKACFLIRGRTVTALTLSVMINLALIAIESLFQYRVVRAYDQAMATYPSIVLEGMLIAYLYALVLVLDTIFGYEFLKSCKAEYAIEEEDVCFQLIEIQEADDKSFRKLGCLNGFLEDLLQGLTGFSNGVHRLKL